MDNCDGRGTIILVIRLLFLGSLGMSLPYSFGLGSDPIIPADTSELDPNLLDITLRLVVLAMSLGVCLFGGDLAGLGDACYLF